MDNYDQQIETLLIEDYIRFCELIDYTYKPYSHVDAWGNTGQYSKSIFAKLPCFSGCCASQIELPHMVKDLDLVDKILKDKKCSLPDVCNKPSDYKFSRKELEEFARRQRVARTLYKKGENDVSKSNTGAY